MSVAPKVDPVVEELGGRLLGDLDLITDRLVAEIYRREDPYAQRDPVTEEDLRTSVRSNLERAVQVLAGRLPEGLDFSDRAAATGRRRARQGMPLETVLRAYRLGGAVIWERLVETARADPDVVDADRLLESAAVVWQVIDEHSARMGEAYRLEESRLRSRDLRRRQALLEALVDGRGADPVFGREAARTLGVSADGPLLCVVALIDTPGSEPLRGPHEALSALGITSDWLLRGGTEFGLVDLGTQPRAEVISCLRARARGRVGTSPVIHGFADISTAYRLAELAAQSLPAATAEVAALEDRLPEALVANSPEVAHHLLALTVAPLLDLPAAERATLVDTVRAVLEHDGSPTRAAAQLFCHRNTVMYRLRRVEELTGRPATEPRDKLLWALGISALQQQSPTADH